MHRQPAHPWLAFLEHNAQKMLWRDVSDVAAARRRRTRLVTAVRQGLSCIPDFTRTGDALRDLALTEPGDRNNEPFMPRLLAADVPALCGEVGLADAR